MVQSDLLLVVVSVKHTLFCLYFAFYWSINSQSGHQKYSKRLLRKQDMRQAAARNLSGVFVWNCSSVSYARSFITFLCVDAPFRLFFVVFCQSVIHEEFKYMYVFIDKEVCHRYVVINYYLVVMTQMLVLFDFWVEKPYYRKKTPLVVGGTRTQVLADSMAIVPPRPIKWQLSKCSKRHYCIIIIQMYHVIRSTVFFLLFTESH